jgi:Phage integrase, N-terminal SAM-like domain
MPNRPTSFTRTGANDPPTSPTQAHSMTNPRRTSTPPKFQVTLSPSSRERVHLAIQRSLAPTTLRSYQATIKLFHTFCDQEGIPNSMRTPTPELLLCAFAAEGLDRLTRNTIRNRIAAMKAWHIANDWQWLGSERLNKVLKGVQNTTLTNRKPKCPPVSI